MSRKKMSIDDFGETPRVMFCPYCGDSDVRCSLENLKLRRYDVNSNDEDWRGYYRSNEFNRSNEFMCLYCGSIFKVKLVKVSDDD